MLVMLRNPELQLQAAAAVALWSAGLFPARVMLQSFSTKGDSGAPSSTSSNTADTQTGDKPASQEETKPQVQPQLIEQFFAAVNSGRRQQLQQRKHNVFQEFQRADGDVGSPEVQIALLTEKIRDMSSHFMAHRKDYHSMRGLQGMLNQRRKLLAYLRRSDFNRYAFVLQKLGLKDTYAKQERYDKYRVGSRLGTPAEALKRYGNR